MGRIAGAGRPIVDRTSAGLRTLWAVRRLTDPGPTSCLVDCGSERHVVRFRGGELELAAHDLEEELSLEALGGRVPACVALWQAVDRVAATPPGRAIPPTAYSLDLARRIGERDGFGRRTLDRGVAEFARTQRLGANAFLATRRAEWERRVAASPWWRRRLLETPIFRPQDPIDLDVRMRPEDDQHIALCAVAILGDDALWAAVLHAFEVWGPRGRRLTTRVRWVRP